MTHPTVLFVGPVRDFEERPYDGLSLRHRRLVEALAGHATLHGLVLSDAPGDTIMPPHFESVAYLELPRPGPASRGARLRRLARGQPRRPPSPWAERLVAMAKDVDPQVVVTFGPWLDEELSPLFDNWRCIHIFEEEVSRMPELAPQSRQAKLLRAGELMLRRHRLAVPAVVVVISGAEAAYARRRFGRSITVEVLPQTLPATVWPLQHERSRGDLVVAIGNFSEARNADALADVVEILATSSDRPAELRLTIISGPGFAPPLVAAAAGRDWVSLVAGESDPSAYYRQARLALVPAERATGFKATILQAWLCGTPVIASSASAQTIELRNAHALSVADSPSELARRVLDIWNDDRELERLAGKGSVAAQQDHDDSRAMLYWCEIISSAATRSAAARHGARDAADV